MLDNQGVQASEWGDVAGVVTQCATRVLKTVGPAPHTLPALPSASEASPNLNEGCFTQVMRPTVTHAAVLRPEPRDHLHP